MAPHEPTVEGPDQTLIEHLERMTGLERRAVAWLVTEIVDYYAETTSAYVVRRHGELRKQGLRNDEAYATIRAELATRPVRAEQLTDRQLRRIVTG